MTTSAVARSAAPWLAAAGVFAVLLGVPWAVAAASSPTVWCDGVWVGTADGRGTCS